MIAVVSDPQRAKKMGAANVAVTRDRADWSKNFPQLARLVEGLTK